MAQFSPQHKSLCPVGLKIMLGLLTKIILASGLEGSLYLISRVLNGSES